MNELENKYIKEVKPALLKDTEEYTSIMQVPKILKIIVNMGVGADAVRNSKSINDATAQLQAITGQKPVVTTAKKSVSSFKLREGMKIGCKVTLHREKMWDFLEKLINIDLPRIRDFKGLSKNSFDKNGNYTFGIKEQIVFPEISYDKIDKIRGLNVTIITSAKTNKEARNLLTSLGFPFAKRGKITH